MNEQSLRKFVAVAKHGSYRRASMSLCVSQPALTRSIQQLEEELGVVLFMRSNKQISLTDAGKQCLNHAVNILAQMKVAKKEISGCEIMGVEEISIGVGTPAFYFVSQACGKFMDATSDKKLNIQFLSWPEAIEKLRCRDLDFVVSNAADYRDNDDLRVFDLPDKEVVFFTRKGHPLSDQCAISTNKVLEYPIVAGVLPKILRTSLEKQFCVNDWDALLSVRCESMLERIELVRHSNCIGMAVRCRYVEDLFSTDLSPLSIDGFNFSGPAISVITLKHRTLSPAVSELISLVRKTDVSL